MKFEDCVNRQAVIECLNCEINGKIESDIDLSEHKREFQEFANMIMAAQKIAILNLPYATPTLGRCKNCRWWDSENNIVGHCHACKHGYMSDSWDIGIYRKTKADFYCADFEIKKGMKE